MEFFFISSVAFMCVTRNIDTSVHRSWTDKADVRLNVHASLGLRVV
jgi:hypothetical protein